MIAGAEDRDTWPLYGASDAPEGQRFHDLLNVVHKRLREHDAVPVAIPLLDQAWPRSAAADWKEAPMGGPERGPLMARVADPRFGGIVRVVVGGSFENFRFADEELRSWLGWAGDVPA